jgi:membrane complex biogenesis BtpA family protein
VLVGVVHLLPLPGAPRRSPGIDAVAERAVADARALEQGGVDALILENYGDRPFFPDGVEAATVAAMARVAVDLRRAVPAVPLGVNVLRNDAIGALAVASAVGGVFIRVNVLAGAMVTDQGILQGKARELALERNRLGSGVRVLADVLVKHASPLAPAEPEDVALDLAERAGADVLVVSGRGTGRPTDPERVRRVASAVRVPVWVGSGLTGNDVSAAEYADGAIVGTWLHEGEDLDAPIDRDRVRAVRAALDELPRATRD